MSNIQPGEWYRLPIWRYRLFSNLKMPFHQITFKVGFFPESHLVYCKSGGGVGELSDQGCRESVVESQEALGPATKVGSSDKSDLDQEQKLRGEKRVRRAPDYDLCLSHCSYVSVLLGLQLDLMKKGS